MSKTAGEGVYMTTEQMRQLTHEARLKIAEEYRLGRRKEPLDATMIRLIVQSLDDEHQREIKLRSQTAA